MATPVQAAQSALREIFYFPEKFAKASAYLRNGALFDSTPSIQRPGNSHKPALYDGAPEIFGVHSPLHTNTDDPLPGCRPSFLVKLSKIRQKNSPPSDTDGLSVNEYKDKEPLYRGGDETKPFKSQPPPIIQKLLQAKLESDRRNYRAKHAIMQALIRKEPDAFRVDSEDGPIVGITHRSGFRMHLPIRTLPVPLARLKGL